jgi:hypothetical protein
VVFLGIVRVPLAAACVPIVTNTQPPVMTPTGSASVATLLTPPAQPFSTTPGSWHESCGHPVTVTYQWYKGASAISGATSSTYQVKWTDRGSTVTVHVTGSDGGPDDLTVTPPGETVTSPPGAINPGYTWSGWDINPPANAWKEASGTFIQPQYGTVDGSCLAFGNPPQTHQPTVADWVGIGGMTATAGLIQAGTQINPNQTYTAWWTAISSTNQGTTTGTTWNYTAGGQGTGPISPMPGDAVNISVSYNAGDSSATFVITDTKPDQTLRYAGWWTLAAPPTGTWYDGTTAEWIEELPGTSFGDTNPGKPYSLDNYGHVDWSAMEATDTNGTSSAPGNVNPNHGGFINMVNGANTRLMSAPTAAGTNTLRDTWYSCN